MSNPLRMAAELIDRRFLLISAALAGTWLVPDDHTAFVYALSYVFHLLNLEAFVLRSTTLRRFQYQSSLFRLAALATLAVLFAPFIHTPLNPWAGIPIALGLALHALSVRALGLARTYYGAELGAVEHERITAPPYGLFPHPMHAGITLQFVGLYLLCPAFNEAYPYLLPGHILLTLATALVEHFDLHIEPRFFRVKVDTLRGKRERTAVDQLRDWTLRHFNDFLGGECSMHRYVKTLPSEVVGLIDDVRYSREILSSIQSTYPHSRVVPLPMTDEFYISRYNYDRGGDQGLFDVHYDGNLRFMPGMSVVRSLIYVSSDDHLEVVFDTSGRRANMKTYDYGLLDFHKERHWVEGSYLPSNPPRILLKCNYYIDHGEAAAVRALRIWLNVAVFYVVKAAMEYSKSPKTLPQKVIGFFCNLFRRLNNLSPALPVLLVLIVALVSGGLLSLPLAAVF